MTFFNEIFDNIAAQEFTAFFPCEIFGSFLALAVHAALRNIDRSGHGVFWRSIPLRMPGRSAALRLPTEAGSEALDVVIPTAWMAVLRKTARCSFQQEGVCGARFCF